jgi:hypothetical protein
MQEYLIVMDSEQVTRLREKNGNLKACLAGALLASMVLIGEVQELYRGQVESLTPTEIDRDGLTDLTTPNGKIFLADRTSEGVIYRPLRSSDRYRIQG